MNRYVHAVVSELSGSYIGAQLSGSEEGRLVFLVKLAYTWQRGASVRSIHGNLFDCVEVFEHDRTPRKRLGDLQERAVKRTQDVRAESASPDNRVWIHQAV